MVRNARKIGFRLAKRRIRISISDECNFAAHAFDLHPGNKVQECCSPVQPHATLIS